MEHHSETYSDTQQGPLDSILGVSAAILSIKEALAQVSPTAAAVMIKGEHGTGSMHIAQVIHQLSQRPGPFVTVNITDLPASEAEAEIFGEAGDSFGSGSDDPRPGQIARAHGGTLFLGKLESAPASLQASLTRFYQTGTITPVGSDEVFQVDVRTIVSVTGMAGQSIRLRPDLLDLASEVRIDLPPLRDRREDILYLATHFLAQANPALSLAEETFDYLFNRSYPGNLRDLRGIIDRAAEWATDEVIRPHDLFLKKEERERRRRDIANFREEFESLKTDMAAMERSAFMSCILWQQSSVFRTFFLYFFSG